MQDVLQLVQGKYESIAITLAKNYYKILELLAKVTIKVNEGIYLKNPESITLSKDI